MSTPRRGTSSHRLTCPDCNTPTGLYRPPFLRPRNADLLCLFRALCGDGDRCRLPAFSSIARDCRTWIPSPGRHASGKMHKPVTVFCRHRGDQGGSRCRLLFLDWRYWYSRATYLVVSLLGTRAHMLPRSSSNRAARSSIPGAPPQDTSKWMLAPALAVVVLQA